MRREALFAAAILGLFAPAASAAAGQSARERPGPSFDCSDAREADEIAICGDAKLAELDRTVARAFRQVLRSKGGRARAMETARHSLVLRRACASDAACIVAEELRLISVYRSMGSRIAAPAWAKTYKPAQTAAATIPAKPSGLPQHVGDCVKTTVSGITDRFGGKIDADPNNGSSVQFANGGSQVSYEKVQAIAHSKVGDPILMCLVSLPADCPPGDNRGKTYTSTNLRTTESWSLPDSQHMCGGA